MEQSDVFNASPGPSCGILIQPGAEQRDQVAEEIDGDEEGGIGFCAGELSKAISQHDWPHLTHQEIGEQSAWQQDGEDIHQADEELLGRSTSIWNQPVATIVVALAMAMTSTLCITTTPFFLRCVWSCRHDSILIKRGGKAVAAPEPIRSHPEAWNGACSRHPSRLSRPLMS